MAEDLGEKTELPTDRRRGEARQRGQLGKSAELSAALALCAGFIMCLYYAEPLFKGIGSIVRRSLSSESIDGWLTGAAVGEELPLVAHEVAWLVAPLMVIAVICAYVIGVSQVGFMLSSKILRPNFERLNPIKGMGKFFSKRSVVKTSIDSVKLSLVIGVTVLFIRLHYSEVVGIAALPLARGAVEAALLARDMAIWILLVLLALGLIDTFYQRWQLTQDLKMTRQDVKDERKSSEGDVEIKGRRLKLARQIALQRIGATVPKADVVVTNPTHFAVALKYEDSRMRAPKVIAKGADYLAMKIRYVAAAGGVPIVERPPLARALYNEVPVGREIHPEHYEAVAEVLAYVYRLERRAAG